MKEILEKLIAHLKVEVLWLENTFPEGIRVPVNALHIVMDSLHRSEGLYFDHLACLTGLDNGPDAGTMEVIYSLTSLPYNHQLSVSVVVPRDNPRVPSVSGIWRTADWHEREAYDLLGIEFTGHADLRRILLPADWEGFPLRKDYQEQQKYHGITVPYDNGE